MSCSKRTQQTPGLLTIAVVGFQAWPYPLGRAYLLSRTRFLFLGANHGCSFVNETASLLYAILCTELLQMIFYVFVDLFKSYPHTWIYVFPGPGSLPLQSCHSCQGSVSTQHVPAIQAWWIDHEIVIVLKDKPKICQACFEGNCY